MNIVYKNLTNQDLVAMSVIAKKAKSFWDYPKEWLELWENKLTFTSDDISHWSCGAYFQENLVAFVTFSQKENSAEIENLWVLPEFMKQGIGRHLMSKALSEAKDRHLEVVRIESDPNAENFYKKFGAIRIGFADATPKPRKLPILEIAIK